jgi:hypothetical protein
MRGHVAQLWLEGRRQAEDLRDCAADISSAAAFWGQDAGMLLAPRNFAAGWPPVAEQGLSVDAPASGICPIQI